MSDTTKLESMILELQKAMMAWFEQVDKRFEQVDKRFEQVDKRFEQVDKRFDTLESKVDTLESRVWNLETSVQSLDARIQRLEDAVDTVRTEMRDDSAATRALLNQAFEHISDQIAREGKPIQPSIVFRTQRHNVTV
jgi:chromosome segregation ATPase